MTFLCFACASDENTTVNGAKIKFFEFPSDEKLQKHWESICTIIPDDKKVKRYICELHFDQSSFSFNPDKNIKPDAVPKNHQTNILTSAVEPNSNLPNKIITEINIDSEEENNSSCNNLKQQKSKPYRLTIQINKVYMRPTPNSIKVNFPKEKYINDSSMIDNLPSNGIDKYKKSEQNGHRCLICYKLFTVVTELYEHVKKHLVCDLCNTEFMSQQLHQSHYKLHKSRIKKFPYKCHICQILFESKDAIRKHSHTLLDDYKGEEEVKVYYCKTCNMTFRNEPTYRKHLNSHMQKVTLLAYHEAVQSPALVSPIGHLRPVIFTCRVCSEEFTSIAEIDKHTKIHMDELKLPYNK